MKAHKSPLILHNFFLLKHDYNFIPIENKETGSVSEITNAYEIDVDFAFKDINKHSFQLFTKIEINKVEKSLPGYALFVEGVCIFSFDESQKLSDDNKSNLLHFSGLNISINSLRNILATTTANGPFGKYSLPSIDVHKLLEEKKSQLPTKDNSKKKK